MNNVPLIQPDVANTNVHVGPLEDVDSTTTPGLAFLIEFLKRYDFLGPFHDDDPMPVEELIAQDAIFQIDGDRFTRDQKLGMLRVRAAPGGASKVTRSITEARDHLLNSGARRIDIETLTTITFRNDPPGTVKKIREINHITIAAAAPGEGFWGWVLVAWLSYEISD